MTEQCPECGCFVRTTLRMPDGRCPRIRHCPYCGAGLKVVREGWSYHVVRRDDEQLPPL